MTPGRLSLRLRRRLPVLLQAEAAECGLACLAMVASFHGHACDLASLRARFSASLRGVTLTQLMEMASDLGLSPRAVRLEPAALARLRVPAVLHWNLDHFVVLERASGRRAWIVDPGIGRRRLPLEALGPHFSGVALELFPSSRFVRCEARRGLRLADFFRGVRNLPGTLARVFVVSLALQAMVLLAPYYGQWVIDQAIPTRDGDLLAVLGLSFATLALLQAAIGAARAALVLDLGSRLQFEWAARLFHHLLRLPLGFFEKRHMADVLSRFRSLSAVQGLVTTSAVEALIDGVMAATTLAVMLAYGPSLALVPVAALCLYLAARLLFFSAQRDSADTALVQGARESGHFLESLRAMVSLKACGREAVREAAWQNRAADAVRATYRVSLLGVLQQCLSQALFAVATIAVVWVGARRVVDGGWTVGMLVAFLAYQSQFTVRAAALADRLLEFRLAGVHVDRVSDIALAEPEPAAAEARPAPALRGAIEARGLSFRHAATEPWVLRGLTLSVRPGECVVVAGPSGCGKTTLLKLLMGLLPPEAGQVLVDGRDLHRGGLLAFRRQIGAVMQDDQLLSGTLAENVAFFDDRPDRARLEACARLAAIHDDIVRLPMGYLTLVGDMGAALSGGQKQRLLLARALYRQPRILFLDEATSHLDPDTERRIHCNLRRLRMTRIMVAHRRETVSIADRVIVLRSACPTSAPAVVGA